MVPQAELMHAVARWIAHDPDPHTRAELVALHDAQNVEALRAMFAGRLAFGTAGLRAILGPGPLAMNRLLVRQSARGVLEQLVLELGQDAAAERGVVVAYDGRRLSPEMAHEAAGVAAAMGLRVHLFEAAAPTPCAAFAVRDLNAACAMVVTASHNPPAYNGLKVFWHTGTQILAPTDGHIAAAIDAVVARPEPVPCLEGAALAGSGRVEGLGARMQQRYLDAIATLSAHPPGPERAALGIAYTPLHGVGAQLAERALKDAGFAAVHTVAAQREPDGAFPTVAFPNPEEAGSMDAVLALAERHGAAIACANDPDADRLAVAARDADGALRPLTGDELGLLLADDALAHAPRGAWVGTTLVSSRLLRPLAAHYGAHYFETLTGFKYLAQKARDASLARASFALAYEEALGYAVGNVVWDKDGISALLSVAKLAAALQARGQTLWHRLEAIAQRVGMGVSQQRTLALAPAHAARVVQQLRARAPTHIGAHAVAAVEDLNDPAQAAARGLPRTNALMLHVQAQHPGAPFGPRIIVRPSGTEPKLKCYYDLAVPMGRDEPAAPARARASAALEALIGAHQQQMRALAEACATP